MSMRADSRSWLGGKHVYKISGRKPAQLTAISMETLPTANNSPITAVVHSKGTHTQTKKVQVYSEAEVLFVVKHSILLM